MDINEQITALPSNELILQYKQAKQVIKNGVYGVNDLQVLQALLSEIGRRANNNINMKTSYTKEEQRKYSMGYQAGYRKAKADMGALLQSANRQLKFTQELLDNARNRTNSMSLGYKLYIVASLTVIALLAL